MTPPTTIRSQVDPTAVTKVTRLFNNSIGDVLAELVQNARRAGASMVDLRTSEAEGTSFLIVSDDGVGIEDPAIVLALGRSGWDDIVARREDPAGMGVFSLAGRDVTFRSRARSSSTGWQISIPAQAWENGKDIPVEPLDRPIGTEIVVALDQAWASALDNAARTAALYCPIPVVLNGAPLRQQDWLAGAAAIFEEDGVRIGVFDDRRANRDSRTINFHGVTVPGGLVPIAEKDAVWRVLVDIVDAPQLQLVLPARKEMVQNDALVRLRRAARRAIYRHIESRGSHRLPYVQWAEAAELGVLLPDARPQLTEWVPATADVQTYAAGKELAPIDDPLIVDDFGPAIEQCAHFALTRDARFAGRLAASDDKMAGYRWYDDLGRVTGMAFEVERNGHTVTCDRENGPGIESGAVDRLELKLTISTPVAELIVVPAPVMIEYDETVHWGIEDAAIVFTSAEAVSQADLADLLDGACFSSSDDRDADSWDTQHHRFLLDARELATRLLHGDDAALLERLRAVLAGRVQWFVPEDRQFHAVIGRDVLDLRLAPPPEADGA